MNSAATTCTIDSGQASCDSELQRMPDDSCAAQPKNPLVSVVVPCYNGAPFLEEALRSALSQSYPEVEIIVVDDGSTDKSPEIAQRFPVRYVRQENRGLTPTRNRGVRESKGSYIIFLDADDRLKPEAIETGVRLLESHPECAMTVGDHHFIGADGSYLAESRKDCLTNFHYEALLKSNFIEMISSVLFRRTVFEAVGGFDTNLRVAEDYELYLRIARDYPICCHPAIVSEYRIHDTNASRNSELMLTMTLRVLKSQAPYVRHSLRRLIAFHEGFRCWRKQYGRQLATELARSISDLGGEEKARKLLLLAHQYPQGLLMLLVLKIVPSLAGRKTLPTFGQPIHGAARNSLVRRRQPALSDLVTVHRGPIIGKVSAPRQKESASL